jgi:hypothetical protein
MGNPFVDARQSPDPVGDAIRQPKINADVHVETVKAEALDGGLVKAADIGFRPSAMHPKDKTKEPSKIVVKRSGAWGEFRILPKKRKPSPAQENLASVTSEINEITGEIDAADNSIAWLKKELADAEKRKADLTAERQGMIARAASMLKEL